MSEKRVSVGRVDGFRWAWQRAARVTCVWGRNKHRKREEITVVNNLTNQETNGRTKSHGLQNRIDFALK